MYVTYVGGKGVCVRVCVCVCVCVRVCGGGWSVLQIFQKLFHSPGDHRAKYFIAPLINFSFLFKVACGSISG